MPANIKHPSFLQPKNENIKIWRYMDFTKFVSLISSKSLFFCRSDLFEDPFEGSYPKTNLKLRPLIYKDMDEKIFNTMTKQFTKISKDIKKYTYINCWHANEYESAAMWKLYSNTKESIAIQTDYKTLKDILNEKIYLGIVKYIDYEQDFLPEGNLFNPFMHKRKSFEHENEVRAIIMDLKMGEFKEGININIDVNKLIKKIYISPTAPSWIINLTKEISKKYNINANIKKSDLYSQPIF